MSKKLESAHDNYTRIARAIEYIAEHQKNQPELSEIAQYVGLSEHHFQRTFTRWAGVSPKQFLQYLTKEYAKQQLKHKPVMEAALSVGLSSSSRLYDLMIKLEKVTPGEFRTGGSGLEIVCASHHSPFGYCFIAATERGICKLCFYNDENLHDSYLDELRHEWPHATMSYDQKKTGAMIKSIFSPEKNDTSNVSVLLKGTEFQMKVWEALIHIPTSRLSSYQDVAERIDQPKAVRAVATAIASNKVAYLIPCHRVIRATGELNQYRWGKTRKAAMIGWESSHTDVAK